VNRQRRVLGNTGGELAVVRDEEGLERRASAEFVHHDMAYKDAEIRSPQQVFSLIVNMDRYRNCPSIRLFVR
jgi:hypothetical protein